MTKVGGKFTTEKRNLVAYVEYGQYELLRQLAAQNGRSVSAEAAIAVKNHLEANKRVLKEIVEENREG